MVIRCALFVLLAFFTAASAFVSGVTAASPGVEICSDNIDNDGDGFVNDGCPRFTHPAEVGEDCANSIDDDGDLSINEGCPTVTLTAEFFGTECANALDEDDDGFVNDGCPPQRPSPDATPPIAEEGEQCANTADDDGDGFINDGCAAKQEFPSESGPECANATDDDDDGFVNDGCPLVVPHRDFCFDGDTDGDGFVNDGCQAQHGAEKGDRCLNAFDEDADGWVNDGCPVVNTTAESTSDCLDELDNDGDGAVNDGCATRHDGFELCGNALDDDRDGFVNDGCQVSSEAEFVGFQCNNAEDDDRDGIVNDGCPSVPDGAVAVDADCENPTSGTDDTVSSTRQVAIGDIFHVCVHATSLPVGEKGWEPDDGYFAFVVRLNYDEELLSVATFNPETSVNDSKVCSNALDDDSDGFVNDGCSLQPPFPGEVGFWCSNAVDDDGDGFVNDGCADGLPLSPEAGQQCANGLDDDADGFINDGCMTVDAPEPSFGDDDLCTNALDDDVDGFVNDGCSLQPPVAELGQPPGLSQCDDANDDDGDGFINDGCPTERSLNTNSVWEENTDPNGILHHSCLGGQHFSLDDDLGEGFIDFGCVLFPFQFVERSYLGPLVQFAFSCEAPGVANISLDPGFPPGPPHKTAPDPFGGTSGAKFSVAQFPTVANAEVECVPLLAYYALGDSVAAGHGLPAGAGQDISDICQRSPLAYPFLVRDRFSDLELGLQPDEGFHLACSGARSDDPGRPKEDLPEQVAAVLSDLEQGPSNQVTLVSITIGANDFNFVEESILGTNLCKPGPAFQAWANDISVNLRDRLRVELDKFLAEPNVQIVLTDYFNPFNQQSAYFSVMLFLNGDCRRLGDERSPESPVETLYNRTQSLIDHLNSAIAAAAEMVDPAGDRVGLATVHEDFQGHESARPRCGSAQPSQEDTLIQYPPFHLRVMAFTTLLEMSPIGRFLQLPDLRAGNDCIHPNEQGAAIYADAVFNAGLGLIQPGEGTP